MPDNPHHLADRLYPQLAKQIRAALDALKASPDIEALDIPDDVKAAVRDIYTRIAATGAQQAAAALSIDFNSVNPAVTAWAERHTGQFITSIVQESRDAIQQAIVEALRQGTSAPATARDIRRFIGLNTRQASALERFAASLDNPSAKVLDRRAAKMIRQRAELIARTELITASNRGQQATWDYAADTGLIPRTAYKEWVDTDDSRTCPRCEYMDGTRIPYNTTFDGVTKFDTDGNPTQFDAVITPPLHPACRCAMVLVLD